MKVLIDDLEVLWPYDYMYPEQYAYMHKIYQALNSGHCLLEMPTGTGKTVSLLALILAYQYHRQAGKGKLVYCTRTVQEMDKVVEELRRVSGFREKELMKDIKTRLITPVDIHLSSSSPSVVQLDENKPSTIASALEPTRDPRIFAVCLSSRRNLCVHDDVSSFDNRNKVDALCRNLTASFVREQRETGDVTVPICEFYEGFERDARDATLVGVYSLSDLKVLGREKGWCPYFFVRHAINSANVVVYNYQYMLDPKISGIISKDLDPSSIIVFDEAHNIDNICIEALSVTVDARMVNAASHNLNTLNSKVRDVERTDSARLQREYSNLLEGLTQAQARQNADGEAREDATDLLAASPVLPSDVVREAVPGNIRRAKHFLLLLRSWIEYLKQRLSMGVVSQETPSAFLTDLQQATELSDTKALSFCYSRLQKLFRTLKLTDIDVMTPLSILANFATVVATYSQGFAIIFEPFDERTPAISDPRLQLCCLDASIAIKPVFERFHSVIITSGTLSPLDVYPRMLNFHPSVSESLTMSLARNVIAPMIVTKGADQVPVSSKFELRGDVAVIQNYGKLLVELCTVVPDGVVGFFTSYRYMEDVVAAWKELGVIDQLLSRKLIFIETKDIVETTLALDSFKRACTCGRGALFLSVARGKVAEGIDFDRHYGRAVIIFGIPFQYTLSRVLRARLQFLQDEFQLSEADFLVFDAMRQTAQCVGRVIRSKNDYGLMIFADARFARADRRSKLPRWITQFMDAQSLNLSTDRAIALARDFLRQMAQPRDRQAEIGVTLLNEEQLRLRSQVTIMMNTS